MLLFLKKQHYSIWFTLPMVKTGLCYHCFKTGKLKAHKKIIFKSRDTTNSKNWNSKFITILL